MTSRHHSISFELLRLTMLLTIAVVSITVVLPGLLALAAMTAR